MDSVSEQHDRVIGAPPTGPAVGAVPSVDRSSVAPPAEATVERRNWASQARRTSVLIFLGDLLLTVAVLYAFDSDLDDVALAALITVTTLGLQRAYRRKLTLSVLDDLPKLAFAGAAGVFLGAATSHRHAQLLPVVIITAALIVALTIGRVVTYAVVRQLRTRGNLSSRTLVIGGGTIGARLTSNALQHRGLGLVPVGIVDANPVPETQTLDVQLFSPAPGAGEKTLLPQRRDRLVREPGCGVHVLRPLLHHARGDDANAFVHCAHGVLPAVTSRTASATARTLENVDLRNSRSGNSMSKASSRANITLTLACEVRPAA